MVTSFAIITENDRLPGILFSKSTRSSVSQFLSPIKGDTSCGKYLSDWVPLLKWLCLLLNASQTGLINTVFLFQKYSSIDRSVTFKIILCYPACWDELLLLPIFEFLINYFLYPLLRHFYWGFWKGINKLFKITFWVMWYIKSGSFRPFIAG